nr:ATP-binding cassette domain-containing protein [Kallotenue papyrolyticum]
MLWNISATLRTGEVLLVTGPNGIGKSTLLRLLAGLLRPSHGAITYIIGGAPLAPDAAHDQIGLVGPDVQLYRELSAREHLAFVADVRGLVHDPDQQQALLEQVGLSGRADQPVGTFSSGMLQRLRYALALLCRPPVLLLDEPTAMLDAAGIALVDHVVAEQRRRGIAVIATNDARDHRYGDWLLRLGAGES